MKTTIKKAIYTRENQNGVEMILKGHDSNGREIWVTVEYHERKYKK